jgi:hypothetical protein
MSEYFWLVIDIPTQKTPHSEKLLNDISNCRLEGVKGISDNKQILTNFFGVGRNAAIFLKAESILPYNDLFQIPYDDPDALCANNLAILARIFNKESGKYARQGIMLNIMQYVAEFLKKTDIATHHTLVYYGVSKIAYVWEDSTDQINNLDDLAAFITKTYKSEYKQEANPSIIREACEKAITRIGSVYSDEGEWMVNSSELIYPVGSPLLLRVNQEAISLIPEWEKNPDDWKWFNSEYSIKEMKNLLDVIHQYRLDKRYKIKYVDARKWDDMRANLWDRRNKKLK